ncbi:hypothetical protein BCR42DRAFT_221060 [Absidia repens]|uniref:Granulins domain-containing protein n=1 Tax=Absidia repens TaxID=90262 RepID=A0A1X2INP3_9FUNG|nr:hypothetical protein BCR42DRAFT_221060 [Absidia repens]
MSKTLLFCLVALLCFVGLIQAAETPAKTPIAPVAVLQGKKFLEAYRVPKAHNFCHAGYGVCPDSHCCPMGGECCDVPGTCCPRDYRCVNGPNDRLGCCPNGQDCEFGDYF